MILKKIFLIVCLSSILGILLSCASSLPISSNSKYPIEVVYAGSSLERPYSEIGIIEIGSEDSLTKSQTSDRRMLNRGNDASTKELLLAKLVLKAQKIGADAIINVTYKYYTSVIQEGYLLSGTAVRYRGE